MGGQEELLPELQQNHMILLHYPQCMEVPGVMDQLLALVGLVEV